MGCGYVVRLCACVISDIIFIKQYGDDRLVDVSCVARGNAAHVGSCGRTHTRYGRACTFEGIWLWTVVCCGWHDLHLTPLNKLCVCIALFVLRMSDFSQCKGVSLPRFL